MRIEKEKEEREEVMLVPQESMIGRGGAKTPLIGASVSGGLDSRRFPSTSLYIRDTIQGPSWADIRKYTMYELARSNRHQNALQSNQYRQLTTACQTDRLHANVIAKMGDCKATTSFPSRSRQSHG